MKQTETACSRAPKELGVSFSWANCQLLFAKCYSHRDRADSPPPRSLHRIDAGQPYGSPLLRSAVDSPIRLRKEPSRCRQESSARSTEKPCPQSPQTTLP